MAASRAHPSAPSLADLPDDLLVACFAQLENPLERRRVLPLVCPRWRRLADEPSLVRSFHVKFKGTSALPRLAAFNGWLERSGAGAEMRSLRLFASSQLYFNDDGEEIQDVEQLGSELQHMLAVCSGLQELRLVAPNIQLSIQEPLASHSALRDLRLKADPILLGPQAALPPALTMLHLTMLQLDGFEWRPLFINGKPLPTQVAALTPLVHLQLCALRCNRDGFGPLSCLTRLTAFGLSECLHLPPAAVVRPLTNLRSLLLDESFRNETEGEASDMLAALPQLTALSLEFRYTPVLPRALVCLTHLQRFVCATPYGQLWPALPGGSWLASLRRAALPVRFAAAQTAALQAAHQLEHLGLWGLPKSGAQPPVQCDAVPQMLQFASQHAPLRSLQFDGQSLAVDPADVAAAVQRAPHLSVTVSLNNLELYRAVVPEVADNWRAS